MATSNPIPFSAEIENVRNALASSGAGEDVRTVLEGLVNAVSRINPNALTAQAVGANPGQAVPAGVSIRVTGANGVFTVAIDDGNQNGKQVWKEVSYSPLKSFSQSITVLPVTTDTSISVPEPDRTFFFRMRTSFDRVNWSNYQLAQVSAVSAGLQSSAATASGAAFAQTNYGVVNSVASGGSADVEISGANGPLTSMVAVKGGAQTVLPSATISGVTPGSTQFVGWDGSKYVLRPTLASVLTDDLTPIGRVSVVSTAAPTLPVIHPIVSGGGVVGFNVVNGGAGASQPYTLTITDPGGPGAGATAGAQTIVAGVLISVAPGNAGAAYDANTIVTPSGGTGGGQSGGGTAAGTNGGRMTNV